MILVFIRIRYKKQRKYVSHDDIIVKFLPIPLAVILANIVLRVKPVEAEFALTECGQSVSETKGYLYTLNGTPVQPEKFAGILSDTLTECGFPIGLAELRHGLEAFSHKIGKDDTAPSHVYSAMANHNPHTSSSYGRDQNCFIGIPADLCEANRSACLKWNTLILDSPSSLLKSTKGKIFQQLWELELIQGPQEACANDNMECDSSLSQGTHQMDPSGNTGVSSDKSQVSDTSNILASPSTIFKSDFGGCTQVVSRQALDKVEPKILFLNAISPEPSCQSKCDMSHGGTPIPIPSSLSVQSLALQIKDSASAVKNSRVEDGSEHPVKKRMVESEQLSDDQKEALCCLQHNTHSAFIIMPTGSGKTSLIWRFKKESECSIIFAPFQLLVKQVCQVLAERNETWVWPFDGSNGSIDCMLATAQFIVLPYEAATESVHLITELHRRKRIGPIWVDEVWNFRAHVA